MVYYEVNISVQDQVVRDYRHWLPDHIEHLLQFPGFKNAEVFECETLKPGWLEMIVVYELRDRESLERYLREDAPRMREAVTKLFQDSIQIHRRVLRRVQSY